jgi:hypothetical protein
VVKVTKILKKKVGRPPKARDNGEDSGTSRGPQEVPEGMVSVQMLAAEAGMEPQTARVKLRASDIEKPEGRWLFKRGSSQLKAARRILGLG